MIRLETVEDFERVDKALKNRDSPLSDYCLIDFGYCCFCRSICAYDSRPGPPKNFIFCRGCSNGFYPDSRGYFYLILSRPRRRVFEFKLGGDIPFGATVRINGHQFFKTTQRGLFSEMLGSRIKALKSEKAAISRKIRRLAKLR